MPAPHFISSAFAEFTNIIPANKRAERANFFIKGSFERELRSGSMIYNLFEYP
jgi:hypothetical protein